MTTSFFQSLLCRSKAAGEVANDNMHAAITEKLIHILTPEVKPQGENAIGNPLAEAKLGGYFGEAVAKVMGSDSLKSKLKPDMAQVFQKFTKGETNDIPSLLEEAKKIQGTVSIKDSPVSSLLGPILSEVKNSGTGGLKDMLSQLTSSHQDKNRTASALMGALGGGALNGNLPGGLNTFSELLQWLPQITEHLPSFLSF